MITGFTLFVFGCGLLPIDLYLYNSYKSNVYDDNDSSNDNNNDINNIDNNDNNNNNNNII